MDNDDFDFDIDFSNDATSDDDIFSTDLGEETNKEETSTTGNGNTAESGITKNKKVAIICIVVCAVLLVIISLVYRIRNSADEEDTNSIEEMSEEIDVDINDEKGSTAVSASSDSWIAFRGDINAEFSDYISSSIIVTGIKNKAMVANQNNDKVIKTVVTGSISGLTGTYEIEIPYSKTKKINIGTEFRVKYRLAEYNGYKVVSDLTYSE